MNRKFALHLALLAMAADPTVAGTGETLAQATAASEPPVPAAPNGFVTMEKQSFHFKTEKLRDDKGTVIGEGKKIPKADLFLPIPKTERLIEILQGGEEYKKERELLMSAVKDVIYGVARGQINDFRESNKDKVVTAEALNYDKLDWTAIANTPAAQRGTSVPSDEDMQVFFNSYLEVMPQATNKPKEKIENHIVLFKTGFKKQRGQKDFLEVFRNALGVYVTAVNEETLEENQEVVEYFSNRLERMLSAEEKITLEDI